MSQGSKSPIYDSSILEKSGRAVRYQYVFRSRQPSCST